jgi:hypothetical protein
VDQPVSERVWPSSHRVPVSTHPCLSCQLAARLLQVESTEEREQRSCRGPDREPIGLIPAKAEANRFSSTLPPRGRTIFTNLGAGHDSNRNSLMAPPGEWSQLSGLLAEKFRRCLPQVSTQPRQPLTSKKREPGFCFSASMIAAQRNCGARGGQYEGEQICSNFRGRSFSNA